jgi:S-(hydroxymethyl)glutathione dehydrogenase/alcohol dehydrogenase
LITRAALFRGPGRPFELADVELEEPGPGDVRIRMAAVGVCGSDLHVVRGEWTRPVPMILGHEGSGVVEAVGDAVRDVREGDRVVVSWAPACGRCGPCLRGRPTACLPLRAGIAAGTLPDGTTRLSLRGETVYRMTAVGALAKHVVLPERAALPLPDGVGLDEAALLGCAALTGVGAVLRAAALEPGATVAVVGTGGVGQFAVQGARIAGASAIVAIDPSPGRREAALAVGATHAAAPADAVATVQELTDGEGVDAAFEAVGTPQTVALALACARPAGLAVLVGMPPAAARLDLDPTEFTNREKTMRGSVYGSWAPAEGLGVLAGHLRAGDLLLEPLLGERYDLEHVDDAVAAALAGTGGRVVVKP